MRFRLALALWLLGAFMRVVSSAAGETERCRPALTFRWTSGEPIRLGIAHPSPDALRNPPFLTDPLILAATVGRHRFGLDLTIRLAPVAAGVLARETARHVRSQMIVMLGGDVLIAAIVMAPFGAEIVLDGHPVDELTRLAEQLRGAAARQGACPEPASTPAPDGALPGA